MKTAVLKKLLVTLASVYNRYTWYGYLKGKEAPPGYIPGDGLGCFDAVKAYVEDFEVVIREHDYSDPDMKQLPLHVSRRRSLEQTDKRFIDIELLDRQARFGRRALIKREVIKENSELYKQAKKLFDDVSKIAKYQRLNACERLDAEQSVFAFCKLIATSSN